MPIRRPPPLLVIPALGALLLVVLPLAGLLLRAPWSSLPNQLASDDVLTALRLSLECSLGALAVCVVLGVPLAYLLARATLPGRRVWRALITLPMVVPPVVGGVALLDAFGRNAFAGRALGALGISLPFTTAGAIVAEAFVALPFLVITVEAGLRQMDVRLEEVAATLGAGPWRRFATVTLPAIAPALAAGAALSWARALGEFGATITFAGNLPGTTQTMPLAVYVSLEGAHPEAAITLALVLLAVSLAVLVGLRDRWLGAA